MIAYQVSAVALLAFGCYIMGDSIITLLTAEHATIGTNRVVRPHDRVEKALLALEWVREVRVRLREDSDC